MAKFEWQVGGPLPFLDDHSGAKLRLYGNYLERYFPTVVRSPALPQLKITIVDGFCGGGAYRDKTGMVDGSPLVLLKSIDQARRRLSSSRNTPFVLDARFHFIDRDRRAIDHLKYVLAQNGYLTQIGQTIELHTGSFADVYPGIRAEIESRTRSGVGRSIFILDQKGYKEAPLSIVRDIMSRFGKAEVLLTFAVDHLIDYMADSPEFRAAVAPLDIEPRQIRDWLAEKRQQRPGYERYAVQRFLKDHILAASGASYISPFFLRSAKSAKDMWVVHLSHHPTARNVMVDSHYGIATVSRHPGSGGLEGWLRRYNKDWI